MTDQSVNEPKGARAAQAANLFDLRRIIGGLFLVLGALLVILGLTDSQAEIDKAAGVNINLWTGLGMLVLGGLFVLWALTRPLGEQLRETAEEDPGGHPADAPRHGDQPRGATAPRHGDQPRGATEEDPGLPPHSQEARRGARGDGDRTGGSGDAGR
jgi:hypothetical protein